jgi:two-component system nitrate/nitrite sensor histidine kinase NarX
LEQSPLYVADENLQTLASMPLVSESKALGALTLGARRPNAIHPHELELLTAIGQQIGVAVENARLHKRVERVATLEERQRIAADMHDGLAQTLSYLGHKVDQATEMAADDQALVDECYHIRHTIDQASRDVRRSIASLQQTPQPSRPIQELLTEVVSDFATNGESAVDLVSTLREPLFLPPDHVEQVMRVVQEGLLNGRRHAHAEHITLTLARHGDAIMVVVEDDGCGFDPNQPPGGDRDRFGLKIMRARAARINGTVQIESQPGRGTRVTLTWPVKDQDVNKVATVVASEPSPESSKEEE